MRMLKTVFYHTRRFAAVLLCFVMVCVFISPIASLAAETEQTIRVGWYESPFNMTDQFGRRSGYAYEYQKKISSYTGWNYEYVTGSWSELLQMLIDGKIDMMSDVSYTEERAELILYPSLPMGAEEYYLFISPTNTEYKTGNYAYFNGKKVGLNKGSVMTELLHKWEKANGIRTEMVELTCPEAESMQMLQRGELDGYITLDAYGGADVAVPVIKIGSSNFYFAISKNRPDLLEGLNAALSRIQDENPYYNQEMYSKYVSTAGANLFLSAEEKAWLSEHGKIRVGYQDDHLSFCDAEEKTGKLKGALKDYLEDASTCFENAELEFEPVAYPSVDAAVKALKNGEVDCMFPSNLSTSDGETLGLIMTPSMMTTEICAVVRKSDQHTFFQKEQITAAVEKEDPNYGAVMLDHFPSWKYEEYSDMDSCLKAVSDGKADCVLISNYQRNNLSRKCERWNLTVLSTGENVDYYIAVHEGSKELYSILTRTTKIVSSTNINAALSYYSAEEAKSTLLDFIIENPAVDITVIVVIIALLTVIFTQWRMIRAKKEVEESHHKVDDLSKRVFVDALTSVQNKGGFDKYIHNLQDRMDNGEQLEFAVVILDCDDLKSINDKYGHDKGDEYIRAASRLICRVYKYSPVFRIGGDEFAVILQNEDYQNRVSLLDQFEKKKEEICSSAENEWEKVSVAIGMAEYDPQSDSSVNDVARHADRKMYKDKHTKKQY